MTFHKHKDRLQRGSLLHTDIRVFLLAEMGRHVVPSVAKSPGHAYHQATFVFCSVNLSDKLHQPQERAVLRF